MPPGRLPLEVFRAHSTGRRPRGRTRWRDYISHLAWEHLGISQEELECVAGEKEAGCHHNPAPDKQKRMDGWMDGDIYIYSS